MLNPYTQARGTAAPKVVLSSKFNTELSGASKGGLARRQPDNFVSLTRDCKHFISTGGAAGRRAGCQFKEEEVWLVALVKRRWLSGDPISTDEIKIHLLAPFGPDDTAVEGARGGGWVFVCVWVGGCVGVGVRVCVCRGGGGGFGEKFKN